MRKPSLEIRVDAVGGAGINDVALDMTNLARATNAVVICEYQPGVLLAAKPSDSALEVASQLPGYEGEHSKPALGRAVIDPGQQIRERNGEWIRLDSDRITALSQKIGRIQRESDEIRDLFIEWGGR